jgi:hypothetical protein
MPATFTVGGTVATFVATVNGYRQDTQDDLPRLQVGAFYRDASEWDTLQSLVTSSYAIHSPIGGDIVVLDIVRGAGQGTLSVDNLGAWFAVLIDVQRTTYLPNDQAVGSATFLLTSPVA